MIHLEWDTRNALSFLEEISDISSINIASAFLELTGVGWIEKLVDKNNLTIDKVRLYLSDEFSRNKPSELLKRLSSIAQV
ncbi:hypothetical protein NZD89_18315 [Alicyclobacillus fastidiosus]|uniref:Uncharacterized protein n=1 Tax=Alicyclobacillus fastidiosus TaxID=392011 RepID=A0ABY6ZCR6_9BACL|nr:hypothetical protein [Alicyclobacillus fastidiosus]WAH40312.1 hypothetical protein NZD89_18315 [Alicyclobacillus fastidiosus]GMA61692.1 hypothetical protein GCM10025859_21320 [Alicyclobacillus fastidiosus]